MLTRRISKALLFPPLSLLLLIDVIAFPFVIYVLSSETEGNLLAIISYALSAYALTVTVIRVVSSQKELKSGRLRRLMQFLPDKETRVFFSLGASTVISTLYGIFSIITGITSGYLFGQSSGIYYILLAILRYYLAGNIRKEPEEQHIKATPWILLSANLLMAVIIAVQIVSGRGKSYPGYLIYAVALYAFYMCILSIINIRKSAHSGNPSYRMARCLSYSVSLITLFSL